jgi:hypothetical protein
MPFQLGFVIATKNACLAAVVPCHAPTGVCPWPAIQYVIKSERLALFVDCSGARARQQCNARSEGVLERRKDRPKGERSIACKRTDALERQEYPDMI